MNIINYNIKNRKKWNVYNRMILPTNYAAVNNYQMCFLIYNSETYEILIAAFGNLQKLKQEKPQITYYIDIINPEQKIYAYMGLKELFVLNMWKFIKAYKEYSDKANNVDTTKFMSKKNKYLKYKNKYLKLKNILLKNE
jgi:hypothetical protein